jgi:hypothetical protein
MHESRIEFLPVLFEGVEDDKEQQLEQIWMPGVHTDVGGGYEQDFLGKISLMTMLGRPILFSNRSRATALVWVVSIAFG